MTTKYDKAIAYILKKLEEKLDPNLYYHGLEHTRDVLNSVENIALAEGVTREELGMLKVAAAYHDSGFLIVYRNHEEAGCGIAFEALPQFGFTQDEILEISGMILATKVPQQPKNRLEEIMCDADLDYLGRIDFEEISESLYREFSFWNIVDSYESWMNVQISFLDGHTYWTNFSKNYREENKRKRIEELRKIKP